MKILVGCFFFLLVSCGSQENTVKIKGSDTEVNVAVMLAEAFRDYRSDVTLSVSGGGSGLGIASLLNGNADVANSSRCINNSETALFAKRGISIDSFVFAIDAVAFVVSGSLPIDTISISELRKLLSGEYKTGCRSQVRTFR